MNDLEKLQDLFDKAGIKYRIGDYELIVKTAKTT